MNHCIHQVTSSVKYVFEVFLLLELVMLHWCHGLGENAESGIWKSLDSNSKAIKDYDIMISRNNDTDEYEGNFENQDGINLSDIYDNYQEYMINDDRKKQKTLFKRGINELREKNLRRKLKHENANPGGDTSSLIDTIIDNPDKIQGPLKDLISKYSEAHKHMRNKVYRNGVHSLAAETKTSNNKNESNVKHKFLIKQNKYGDNKDVSKDNSLLKTSDSNEMTSQLNSNTNYKKDDSNNLKFQSPDNFVNIKNKPMPLVVYSGKDSKANLRKRKKNHKIKEISKHKLGAYYGDDNGGNNESNEDIRRNYINRLIQIKPVGEYNTSNSEQGQYANMSSINEGFLNAVEKKYFSMNNGALTKFKPKTSIDFGLNSNIPENTESQKNNRILNNNENEDINRIRSSIKSNRMPNNKILFGERFDNVNHNLETGTYKGEGNKTAVRNNSLELGTPKESTSIRISADDERKKNTDMHPNHKKYNKHGFYEVENKDSIQTPTQRFKEPRILKVKLQDTQQLKKASHILPKNKEKQNTYAYSNEKQNKKRSHKPVATGYTLKESDSLDPRIKNTNIARKEIISKKNHLAKTKDHLKRRNERDIEEIENENPELRKYRIGVDSRGRSRLMVSDIDESNNSGHNTGFGKNKKGDSKRNVIGPNNKKQFQYKYSKGPLEEELNEIEDNDVEYTYDDGNANDDDSNEDVDVKKVFARRAHHPKCNEDESSVTDFCVEYKGENDTSSSKNTSPTVPCPTTTDKTDTQSRTTKRNTKEKMTQKTNIKAQISTSKSADTESTDNSISNREVDDYEQLLKGVFADNFVNAVLAKVQRSRKMANELGFGNDTDESSDRCLETKMNKMPDLEVLRKSLKDLPKSGQKKISQSCYRVPKPMEDFLLLLISYEKEQESSVYKNIQDESSFIFTGDYPESSVREDKVGGNEKYDGEKDSIGKDTFEKQHLHEEENEDKNNDQFLSRKDKPLSNTVKPSSRLQEEELTGKMMDENDDNMLHDDLKKRKVNGKKVVHKNKMHSSPQYEQLKENDLVNIVDSEGTPPYRYNHYVDPENVFDTNNAKHRRQSYKTEKVPSLTRLNMEYELDSKEHQNSVDTGEFSNFNIYNNGIPNAERYGGRNVQNNRLTYGYPNSHQVKRNFGEDDIRASNANTRNNHCAKPSQFYEYPQESWAEREGVNPAMHRDPQYLNSNDVLSHGEKEYQLYPNLNGDDIPLISMTDYRYHKNDHGGNSRMVKRDTDPSYDDDFLFFEVPDIEYDLY